MTRSTTSFEYLFERFYKRLEKDEDFFDYYNIPISEAIQLAHDRAKGYLIDTLEVLSSIEGVDVDFTDYDEEIEEINFKTVPRENRLIVNLMFQFYMERDIPLLHAFQINFSPSDLNIITPSTERSTYLNLVNKLKHDNDELIDAYRNRDRETGKLKYTINYSDYADY